MKKFNLLTVLIMLAFASVSFGQIGGSAHDFSGAGWNTSDEICITCHTPHNALSQDAPLWNHTSTSSVFTLYSSSTFQATDIAQPGASSKMCLSCHDGVVALDSYGGATGSTMINDPSVGDGTGSGLIGIDLSDDHPISFTYDATLVTADGELHSPPSDMLFGGKMQCSSCHDVHNSAGHDFLLVMDNDGSALCLTCHNK